MSEKWATPEGTAKYFQGISIHSEKQKQFDGLSVSALGAGTYLGSLDDATDKLYEQSLLQAGLNGINFFDTAIHYRCQRSERVLRKVIEQLNLRGILRDQLVIASKGGYLPSEGSPDELEDYVRKEYLDKRIIEEKEIVAGLHCISPAFLENQIHSSLANLGIECIDLYYLHNVETQFLEIGEEEFYARLTEAFALLEQKVQENKIRRYGLATWNGFRQKADRKATLQFAKILACACEAGGANHHFKAIQLPYNLVMLEILKQKNQIFGEERKTVIETAAEYKISVMVSSPLMQSQVKYLSRKVFDLLPSTASPILKALEFVLSTPHVCTAFCGMKHPFHWEENKKVLNSPIWPADLWIKATESLGIAPE